MSTFKRVRKNFDNDQQKAFASIIPKFYGGKPERMIPDHTDTHFVWTYDADAKPATPVSGQATGTGDWRAPKSKFETENHAVHEAMADLNTFEGNLTAAHTDEYYVYNKVRQ